MRKLLEVLHALVDQGNTVVVIEHNLEVIKTADWILDLGPEGGDGGGRIVAAGTPEDIRNPDSYTGRFLAPLLMRATRQKVQHQRDTRSAASIARRLREARHGWPVSLPARRRRTVSQG